ncbi:MAG: ABC transporter ATP-binding protein [Alphaproteobacteria bacterium]
MSVSSAAGEAPDGPVPLLRLDGIVKRFPGTLANDHVDLTVLPGEIHALLGENGAGKSTLVKIIYGSLQPDEGAIRWQGQRLSIASPAHARRLGIGMVFQHFSLFEALTVAENIALGLDDARDRAGLAGRIADVSRSYGLPLDPSRTVHALSVGERQRIEIVRCLLQKPRLLIMDEPTSVLTPQEVERLFETLRRLAAEGCSILYISHKLEEIRALCETATIMRQGRVVAHCDPRAETTRRLAELMIGSEVKAPSPRPHGDGSQAPRLVVDRLTTTSGHDFGTDLRDISFTVGGGRVLGIAGIAGNGQTELMEALSGEVAAGRPETIRIDGTAAGHLGPRRRRALGACFVPEERNGHGAVTAMTLAENIFLSGHVRRALVRLGLIDTPRTNRFADEVIARFDVRTTGSQAEARALSGGNLQKLVVGREVMQDPTVLVLSQPTWGVDAGAAAAIHQAIFDLAAAGTAIVVISQDLDEIFALCDDIAVIAGGRLSPPRPAAEQTVAEIGILMGGIGAPATSPEAPRAAPA